MTEPIFALVYVIALRLHHRNWIKTGMIVASLMILARPEGLFLGALWGVWVLRTQDCGLRIADCGLYLLNNQPPSEKRSWIDSWWPWIRNPQSAIRNPQSMNLPSAIRNPQFFLLLTGVFIWWLAALILTGDPLFIKHNWPSNWPMTGTIYGAAGLYAYPIRLPEIIGMFLLPVFVYGLIYLLKQRRFYTLTSSFLLFFALHTILRAFGLSARLGTRATS